MIINRIYETQNLLSLQLVSFLVGLRTYQHPCTGKNNFQMLYSCERLSSRCFPRGTTTPTGNGVLTVNIFNLNTTQTEGSASYPNRWKLRKVFPVSTAKEARWGHPNPVLTPVSTMNRTAILQDVKFVPWISTEFKIKIQKKYIYLLRYLHNKWTNERYINLYL